MLAKAAGLAEVEGDEADQVGALVAIYASVGDPATVTQPGFDVLRRDVLAAGGYDQILLAAGDADVAVFVYGSEIAAAQPVAIHRLDSGLWISVVAAKYVRSSYEDLAVVGDPNLAAGHHASDRAEMRSVVRVERAHRAGLGHAPALEDQDAAGVEELEQLAAHRCGADDAHDQPGSEHAADLREHHPVGEAVTS